MAYVSSNRFRRRSDAIAYSVVKLQDGWRIEVNLPSQVSQEDREAILNWFQSYRSKVRAAHPLWIANFHPGKNAYWLEVRPVSSGKELLEKGQNLKNIWADEIASRA